MQKSSAAAHRSRNNEAFARLLLIGAFDSLRMFGCDIAEDSIKTVDHVIDLEYVPRSTLVDSQIAVTYATDVCMQSS